MRRISWKRGMRLTDEILRASDQCASEYIGYALALAAGGRFGLLPAMRPFDLTLNIGGNVIDVVSLSCLAVTKNGMLIDVQYDSKYTNTFDTRVVIPDGMNTKEFILTVNAAPDQWHETQEGYEEPAYSFSLFTPDTPLPGNAFPIARIEENYGWREDEVNFVPPCLFVSSHRKYEELLQQFSDLLASLDAKAQAALNSGGKNALRIFWPIVQQIRIAVSKETDLMTPMALLSNVQKCVSAFTCANDLESMIELPNARMFRNYVCAPYNYRDSYQRIKVGLELCFSISQMVDKLKDGAAEPVPTRQDGFTAPFIADSHLFLNCSKRDVSIPVSNPTAGAKVFYSVDGSEPSRPLPPRGQIVVSHGFNTQRVPEPDKQLTIKLKALMNGKSSSVASFVVVLHKDYNKFGGPII